MSKPAILVVDDDPQVRAAVRRDLRARYEADYAVVAAPSGEDALTVVNEFRTRGVHLALLLSDQRMPGMQGVELLARAREIYPLARRVLLTAYSDIEAAVRAINEAHLDYYLSKPWHPPEERLYPVMDDQIEAWQAARPPDEAGLRVVGSQWSPRSHEIKNFLAGNLIPYRWLDVDRDPDARVVLAAGAFADADLPAVLLESGTVLRSPTVRELAETLRLRVQASLDLYDLAIIGAGPAGLAAAVYGASEGLKTLLIDRHGPGGQAGTSSQIENYLGFPTGVSGAELARRAILQAQRLGAEFVVPVDVTQVDTAGGYKRLALADGREVVARALVIATGMTYRQHPATGMAERTGAGVYYGAAASEAHAFRDCRVMVVGGGNSAGQCALHLSRYARSVQLVIRRESLDVTMSRYLIDQIAAAPEIQLRSLTALDAVAGNGKLEQVTLRSLADDATWDEPMDAVFVFIGTRPHSEWLPPAILRNPKGFVLTGLDGSTAPDFRRIWRESRDPFPLETSVPGIFAAGDVRAGAMNRVAAAVGEGAMAVRLTHDYFALI